MPNKPKKPCSKHGCKNLTTSKFCKEHKQVETTVKAERDKHYDKEIRQKRDKEYTDFYQSEEWKIARKRRLMLDHGLCQECRRKGVITYADVVHHKVPIKVDWDRRLDIDNLESLCHRCHNKQEH